MGEWYEIGLLVGLGVAIGVLVAGIQPRPLVAGVAGALLGFALGYGVAEWEDAIGALIGGLAGGLGAAPVVRGALRRGGTRLGVAVFVTGGAIVIAGLAFIPVVGYLLAVAVPAFALRLRSQEPEKHAGLRTLARD
jgi:hypothetical protein